MRYDTRCPWLLGVGSATVLMGAVEWGKLFIAKQPFYVHHQNRATRFRVSAIHSRDLIPLRCMGLSETGPAQPTGTKSLATPTPGGLTKLDGLYWVVNMCVRVCVLRGYENSNL